MLCPYAAYHFANTIKEFCKGLSADSVLSEIKEEAHVKFRKFLENGNISEKDIEGEMIRLDVAIDGIWEIHCRGKQ